MSTYRHSWVIFVSKDKSKRNGTDMGLNRNRSTKEKEYHVVDGTDNVIGLLVEGRDFEGELKILVIFLQVRLGLQPPAQLTNITFYIN